VAYLNGIGAQERGEGRAKEVGSGPPLYRRSGLDRRWEGDRREAYQVDCAVERRVQERRTRWENRQDWVRISKWVSVCIEGHCEDAAEYEVEAVGHHHQQQERQSGGEEVIREGIDSVVHAQLRAGKPAVVVHIMDRLLSDGCSSAEAMRQIGDAYALSLFRSIREQRLFDEAEYTALLTALPAGSW